jgi:prepilin-type N-terminal cleavage/methylation domain-containing protein
MFHHSRHRTTPPHQRGYSLVEIAIVLAVIGTIIGVLWVAASRAWEYTRRERAREAIAITVANMRSYYGGQAGVPGALQGVPNFVQLDSQLLAANVIPNNLSRGPGAASCTTPNNLCADHPWGSYAGGVIDNAGTFNVCNWTLASGSFNCGSPFPNTFSSFFGVQLMGLSRANCFSVVETISSASEPTGLVEVNINGVNLMATGNPIQPVSDLAATNACKTQTDGNDYVIFVYRVVVN